MKTLEISKKSNFHTIYFRKNQVWKNIKNYLNIIKYKIMHNCMSNFFNIFPKLFFSLIIFHITIVISITFF